MSEYPKMLFRRGSEAEPDNCIVGCADEEAQTRSDGWCDFGDLPAPASGKSEEAADNSEIKGLKSELQAAAELLDEVGKERDALKAEIADLKAKLAAFDGDGDGKPGGSRKKGQDDGN